MNENLYRFYLPACLLAAFYGLLLGIAKKSLTGNYFRQHIYLLLAIALLSAIGFIGHPQVFDFTDPLLMRVLASALSFILSIVHFFLLKKLFHPQKNQLLFHFVFTTTICLGVMLGFFALSLLPN
ncbi:MAG: hypothetical protein C4308_12440 [Chitinophagaceae bacterium]